MNAERIDYLVTRSLTAEHEMAGVGVPVGRSSSAASTPRRIARIEHPHIVPLYDFWREPDGAYLVLRYLRGGSLRERLSTSDPLHHRDALRIADQIAQASAAAHQVGVVTVTSRRRTCSSTGRATHT